MYHIIIFSCHLLRRTSYGRQVGDYVCRCIKILKLHFRRIDRSNSKTIMREIYTNDVNNNLSLNITNGISYQAVGTYPSKPNLQIVYSFSCSPNYTRFRFIIIIRRDRQMTNILLPNNCYFNKLKIVLHNWQINHVNQNFIGRANIVFLHFQMDFCDILHLQFSRKLCLENIKRVLNGSRKKRIRVQKLRYEDSLSNVVLQYQAHAYLIT